MRLPVTVEQLRGAVESEADDALGRVVAATRASSELSSLGDAVLDSFVRSARESGCSWAEIGESLGVSRQAAHLRYRDREIRSVPAWPESFSGPAREVVANGGAAARELGHGYLGTEHVLVAILATEGNVACDALQQLGLTPEAVHERIVDMVGVGEPCRKELLGVAVRLKKAFELAQELAGRLGHSETGTEHLLLGLAEADGVAGQILAAEGIPLDRLRTELAHRLGVDESELVMRRRRLRRRWLP